MAAIDILLQCYLEAWATLGHGWIKELCSEGLPTGKLWDIVIVIDYVGIDALSRFNDANSEVLALESQLVGSSGSKQVEAKQKGTELAQSKLGLALLQYELPSMILVH
ncbi:uncharacterized protein LOC131336344 [Rhododendron vialii]|uniref:uncharacterized protein LOC131336344 n=1 Tax=Rhododendron vialii TaxID=182163 RepID=UPI0026602117|nr:uncharacterized protein LOC131336344 [Rhododendron vialii]